MKKIVLAIAVSSCLLQAQNRWVNNRVPLHPEKKFLYKETTLLDEKKLNLAEEFSCAWNLNIDRDRNLYFVVFNKIIVCNPEGKIIRQLGGRRGQGPGELQNPPGELCLDKEENLWLSDGYKFVKWDRQGNPLPNRLFIGPGELAVTRSHAVRLHYSHIGYKSFRNVSFLPIQGGETKTIFSAPAKDFLLDNERGDGMFYHHAYIPRTYFCLTGDETIAYGDNQEYKVYLADGRGRALGGFTVAEKAVKVASDEIEVLRSRLGWCSDPNYAKKMPTPDHRPFYKRLLGDEKGRIWVVRIKSCKDKSPSELVDVFDRRGAWLYRLTLPREPLLIRDGAVYAVEQTVAEDDEVYNRIIKFTISDYAAWE